MTGKVKQTICLDFDGVIHRYSKGFYSGKIYDIPMEGAIKTIIELHEDGYNLVISTCRQDIKGITRWLKKHGLPEHVLNELEITNEKPIAMVYIDDRALRFTNWQDIKNYYI